MGVSEDRLWNEKLLDGLTWLQLQSFEDNSYDMLVQEVPYRTEFQSGTVYLGLIDADEPHIYTEWPYELGYDTQIEGERTKFRNAFPAELYHWGEDAAPIRSVSQSVLDSPVIDGQVYAPDLTGEQEARIEELSGGFFEPGLLSDYYEPITVDGEVFE